MSAPPHQAAVPVSVTKFKSTHLYIYGWRLDMDRVVPNAADLHVHGNTRTHTERRGVYNCVKATTSACCVLPAATELSCYSSSIMP